MFDLIKKLTGAVGVSGNEEEIRELIIQEIKDYVDEINVDALGNLIAVKKSKGKKIMVAAHMDEIGLMVTHIDEKGFLRFSTVGGISRFDSIGQRVRFKNGTVGAVYYEDKLEDMKDLRFSKMYIDIGASNREEAEKSVKIGDTACFAGEAVKQGDMVISKALDDRSGCAVVVKAIKDLPQTDNEIYFVFTVQEELGLRGAGTAAYSIKPDMAIAVDVTMTGDTPESHAMEVKCGRGPAIKIKDRSVICHPQVRKLLEEAAEKNGIPYQLEILEAGGSDPGSIHITAGGIPSGAISIPCRYVHSPVETASLKDIENAARLLIEAIKA
ncbi:MAG TPA: M42 family metallopeptidase [Acetivibrio sp.]|nr:M42 family metallopeptidase [Clostridium sp.]HOQ36291.1 M42 family metallopeptidase [Acetivibrio sp.]HQA56270.1 M42 family metallopeptidase [Acetivibrio sp.]